MTYQEYIEIFENRHFYLEHSEETIRTYKVWIRIFFDNVNKNVEDIVSSDVSRFLMSNKKWSSSTKNTILSSLNSFYSTLIKLDLVKMDNPCDNVDVPKVKNEEKIPLNKEEQNILIRNGKNARDKAILTFMFSTGVRVGELINITLNQYLNMGELRGITLTETKGDKERTIYLNDRCVQAIEDYLLIRKETDCDKLFVSNGGKPMDRTCMSRTIKTIARRSGAFEEDRVSKLCNHLLRTSFATTKAEEGVTVEVLSKAMGHSTTAVTSKVYVKIGQDAIRMAMC